jgi:hypothetical protein
MSWLPQRYAQRVSYSSGRGAHLQLISRYAKDKHTGWFSAKHEGLEGMGSLMLPNPKNFSSSLASSSLFAVSPYEEATRKSRLPRRMHNVMTRGTAMSLFITRGMPQPGASKGIRTWWVRAALQN